MKVPTTEIPVVRVVCDGITLLINQEDYDVKKHELVEEEATEESEAGEGAGEGSEEEVTAPGTAPAAGAALEFMTIAKMPFQDIKQLEVFGELAEEDQTSKKKAVKAIKKLMDKAAE